MADFQFRQEKLRKIVNNAQWDKETRDFIIRQAAGILINLGVGLRGATELLRKWTSQDISDLTEYEALAHQYLRSNTTVCAELPDRMLERAKAWIDRIGSYVLPDVSTLDLGGGSGEVANILRSDSNFSSEISIADPLDYRRYKDIPYRPIQGSVIDAADGEFEQTIILTVWHHTDEVEQLVSESFRVTRKRVIVIESTTENLMMYRYGCWIDWFYNHILQYNPDIEKKVNVPCNLKSSDEWERIIWKLTGLTPMVSKNLGIYQWLNPENHHLFVYEK